VCGVNVASEDYTPRLTVTFTIYRPKNTRQVTAGEALTAQQDVYPELPAHAIASCTIDNGPELAHHHRLAGSMGISAFFRTRIRLGNQEQTNT
jgi:IS30 family transposase